MRVIIYAYRIKREKVNFMTKKEKKILLTFARAFPNLTELEKERLLSFGEGMVFKTSEKTKNKPA